MSNIKTLVIDNSNCKIEANGHLIINDELKEPCDIIIPSKFNNVTIKNFRISKNSNRDNIISVRLPDTINTIGACAFEGCSNLKAINIPNSVTFIDSFAFSGCKSLISVILPCNIKEISVGTFKNCSNLRYINISNNIESINSHAFYRCKKLESVVIPNTITEIHLNTFYNCESLSTIKLPVSVKYIYENAFDKCPSLRILYEGSNEELNNLLKFSDKFAKKIANNNIKIISIKGIENDINAFNIDSLSKLSSKQKEYVIERIDEISNNTQDLNEKLKLLVLRDNIGNYELHKNNYDIEI